MSTEHPLASYSYFVQQLSGSHLNSSLLLARMLQLPFLIKKVFLLIYMYLMTLNLNTYNQHEQGKKVSFSGAGKHSHSYQLKNCGIRCELTFPVLPPGPQHADLLTGHTTVKLTQPSNAPLLCSPFWSLFVMAGAPVANLDHETNLRMEGKDDRNTHTKKPQNKTEGV